MLDNARFHHGGDLKQIAEQYNIELKYLPPYSPQLNPIEQLWAVIKQKVRLTLSNFGSLKRVLKVACYNSVLTINEVDKVALNNSDLIKNEYFTEVLKKVRPSVSYDEIEKYEEFAQNLS